MTSPYMLFLWWRVLWLSKKLASQEKAVVSICPCREVTIEYITVLHSYIYSEPGRSGNEFWLFAVQSIHRTHSFDCKTQCCLDRRIKRHSRDHCDHSDWRYHRRAGIRGGAKGKTVVGWVGWVGVMGESKPKPWSDNSPHSPSILTCGIHIKPSLHLPVSIPPP